ncbi:PrgI family protein [Streptomyces monomycini]|uniref:PrgI family protein n=1 Tax=Streptomyces monomycini TaxID=371720 RepID=UPI001EE9AFFF|nr:PrgI family protein [Streptomyces monomycini]
MTQPVRIPADVDREDTLWHGLTARQLFLLTSTGLALYALWSATRTVLPLAVFAVVALPVAVTTAVLVLGRRDGLPLDRLLLAAVRQRLAPHRHLAAPEGLHSVPAWLTAASTSHPESVTTTGAAAVPLRLPAHDIASTGLVDLGPDGVVLVAECTTVDFALRTPAEQDALIGAFGRYLHSLTAPVQVLVRAERLDVTAAVAELRAQAPALPHPALQAAAVDHADFLDQLAREQDLLRRQVLLVLREPGNAASSVDGLGGPGFPAALAARRTPRSAPARTEAERHAVGVRVTRRLADATTLLGLAGIAVCPLDVGQTTAVLAAACSPDSFLAPSPHTAGAHHIITAAPAPPPGPGPALLPSAWSDSCPSRDDSQAAFAPDDDTGHPDLPREPSW